jgi:hypothetical protein
MKKNLLFAAIVTIVLVVGYLIFIREDNGTLPQCEWGPADEIVNEPCENYSGGGP